MLHQRLAQQKRAQLQNTQTVQPTFRGAALEIQSATDFEIIIQGPAETGKTFAVLWHVDSFLRQHRNAVGILVRKTKASIYSTVLRTFAKVRQMRGNDIEPFGGQKPEWYDYPNGSRLYIDGLDKADRLLSGEFDIIACCQCEQLSIADWEILSTRATGRAGNTPYTQIIGDCNPAQATHWIMSRNTARVLPSYHKDNPRLFNDAGEITEAGTKSLDILANRISGVRRDRLFLGLWVSAEGAIYIDYDPEKHLIDWFEPPKQWPRYCSIDFGFNNPFVCQWWSVDPFGRLILYREIYMTGRLVEDHAKTIQMVEKWYFYNDDGQVIIDAKGNPKINPAREAISARIADHDAEDRATLSKYGINTIAAYKAVKIGIEAVQSRFKQDTILIMRDCLVARDENLAKDFKPLSTADEIQAYVWQPTKEGKQAKDEPKKIDDHGCDAKRYMVCFIDRIGIEIAQVREVVTYDDYQEISEY